VINTSLAVELTNHLGYDKHDPMGQNGGDLAEWHAGQDGADRVGPGGDHGAAGP